MKMYILVKESIELGYAMTAVAHASLIGHLKFSSDAEYQEWLSKSFKKVVCMVNDSEFERAKTFEDCAVVTESALGGAEVALVCKPRKKCPNEFRFYRLYSATQADKMSEIRALGESVR